MKCRRHTYEVGAGVCASCLRERLLALAASQNELSPEHHQRRGLRRTGLPPPPILFPRSVSPYASHRRSVDSATNPHGQHHPLFHSTPQIGPSARDDGERRRSTTGKFSILAALFGHTRSEESELEPRASKRSGTSSWIFSIVRRRKKKNSRTTGEDEPPLRARRSCRGMSPAWEDGDESASESGYSTESSSRWRRPTATPMRRHPTAASHRHAPSGLSFCLSPLVRASPGHWNSQVAEAGFSGDIGGAASSHRQHRRGAAALAPTGSRKLADMGRFR